MLKLFVSCGVWLGLGLVALGLLLPFWVQPEYAGIAPLMELLRSTPTGNSLILTLFFLMLWNTLYSLPYYLGSFLLADEVGERMQRTWIKAALPLAVVPLLSFAVQQYNSLKFTFGIPDILLLLAMLILQKLAKGRLSFPMKSFILVQLLIGFQSLEVVPCLSAAGFGSHPYLLEIKQVSRHIGFDQALNTGGLLVCFILLINTAILSAFFTLSLQKWNDRKTLHLAQLEAIQSRSGREVLHLVHDLKTPLASMEGLISLIEMRVPDEKIKEYCRICSRSISSMSEMISEMLYEDRKSWFHLEEVMDYVRASRLSGTNVSVDMDMPVEDNVYIWVNKIRVTRALVNLLDNAFDAIKDKENGRVTLHARVQGNEVSLGVSDNGPGIPPDKQERVWQAGYSTKRHPGLGLAFVKQVAEGHNGSVTIQSGIGEGTTVWMHLWGGKGQMKILIMDDDASVRFMLSEICSAAGWQTETASNGREGLHLFSGERFDVVLVDYHMPEMDGMMAVQEIRRLDKEVPILVLTVDERQEIADRFLDRGATDFALKPVRAPDLISRIQLHIRLSQLTKGTQEGRGAVNQAEEELASPKGISKTTLSHIVQYLRSNLEPSTVDEITKEVGLAYPTVYRSLVYLMQKGKVRTIISYQKVGRPKNRYEWRSGEEA